MSARPMSFSTYSPQKNAPHAIRLTEMSDEMHQKLVISGVSLVPQAVVFFVLALVLYLTRRGPILRNAYFDVLLWLGLFALSFGVNFGSMFVPWPIPLADVPDAPEVPSLSDMVKECLRVLSFQIEADTKDSSGDYKCYEQKFFGTDSSRLVVCDNTRFEIDKHKTRHDKRRPRCRDKTPYILWIRKFAQDGGHGNVVFCGFHCPVADGWHI